MMHQNSERQAHTVETETKSALAWETVQALAQKVHQNLHPFRINDQAGYTLQNRKDISATFARHGFRFNEAPFQAQGIKHAAPDAVALEVARQIVPSAVQMRQGKKFTSARTCLEKTSGDCVIAFGRAIDPERALDKLAANVVKKMGGGQKILGLVIVPYPERTEAAASPAC